MKMVYTVWDRIAKEAGSLFISNNDDTAKRQFEQFLNGLNPAVEKNDFRLLRLGSFDQELPCINSMEGKPYITVEVKLEENDE